MLCPESIDRLNIALVVAPLLNSKGPLDELGVFLDEEGAEQIGEGAGLVPMIVYIDDKLDITGALIDTVNCFKRDLC